MNRAKGNNNNNKRKQLKIIIRRYKRYWLAACEELLDFYENQFQPVNTFCPLCGLAHTGLLDFRRLYPKEKDYCKCCIWYFFTGYSCGDYAEIKKFTNKRLKRLERMKLVYYLKGTKDKRWVGLRKKQLSKWVEKLKRIIAMPEKREV